MLETSSAALRRAVARQIPHQTKVSDGQTHMTQARLP